MSKRDANIYGSDSQALALRIAQSGLVAKGKEDVHGAVEDKRGVGRANVKQPGSEVKQTCNKSDSRFTKGA